MNVWPPARPARSQNDAGIGRVATISEYTGTTERGARCADQASVARTTVAGGEIAVISNDADEVDEMPDGLFRSFDVICSPGDNFDIKETVTAADDRIYELHYIGGDGTNVTAHLITDDDQGGNNCVVGGYAVLVP